MISFIFIPCRPGWASPIRRGSRSGSSCCARCDALGFLRNERRALTFLRTSFAHARVRAVLVLARGDGQFRLSNLQSSRFRSSTRISSIFQKSLPFRVITKGAQTAAAVAQISSAPRRRVAFHLARAILVTHRGASAAAACDGVLPGGKHDERSTECAACRGRCRGTRLRGRVLGGVRPRVEYR